MPTTWIEANRCWGMPSAETSRWIRSSPNRTPSGSSEASQASAVALDQARSAASARRAASSSRAPPGTRRASRAPPRRRRTARCRRSPRSRACPRARVDLGAQRVAPLLHPPPHLVGVDVAGREDLDRAEAGEGLARPRRRRRAAPAGRRARAASRARRRELGRRARCPPATPTRSRHRRTLRVRSIQPSTSRSAPASISARSTLGKGCDDHHLGGPSPAQPAGRSRSPR